MSNTPNSRIKDIINKNGGASKVAKITNIDINRWYRVSRDGHTIKDEELMALYEFFGVTPNEILLNYDKDTDSGFVKIDFFPNVKASAGHGLLAQDEEPLPIKFRSVFVRQTLNSSPSDLFAMKVKGDSMFPTIKDGDLLIVDKSKVKAQSERPYVVVQDEQVSVKYIRMLSVDKLMLISENKSFGDQEIDLSDGDHFRILGEVRHIQRTLN